MYKSKVGHSSKNASRDYSVVVAEKVEVSILLHVQAVHYRTVQYQHSAYYVERNNSMAPYAGTQAHTDRQTDRDTQCIYVLHVIAGKPESACSHNKPA